MLRNTTILLMVLCGSLTLLHCTSYKMLVGTYTRNTPSEGIYALEFDGNANLISKALLIESDNPSYLSISPDEKYLYAVNESGQSFVCAYQFDKTKPALTFLNKSSVQRGPCYITSSERHVFTANYSSGSLTVLGRKPNGEVTDTLQVIKHPRKQFGRGLEGPSNAHQIIFSPNGKFLVATNLGTDRVFSYQYNPNSETEILQYTDEVIVKKGSGPRHATFSKDGRFLYLVQELDGSLTVFSVTQDGKLAILQETTLVTDKSQKSSAADIHLSPDGKFLYATNRADVNNITCFQVLSNGTVKLIEQYPTLGNHPRNFTISPDGKFIFIGNQRTNNITIYKRNERSGKLKLKTDKIDIGAPACLLFY